jgi:hypothetical protein
LRLGPCGEFRAEGARIKARRAINRNGTDGADGALDGVFAACLTRRMSDETSSNEPVAIFAEPKPGYRTSEFIGKLAVQAIALAVLFGVIPTDDQSRAGEIALALIGAVEGAYAYSRGLVKKGF